MKPFLSEDFLLQTQTAKALYHQYAKDMPIYDYHCHLPVQDIAENKKFENLTQIWLYGDHYKWRAMRANGVAEDFITGNRSDFEKFQAWAATVPKTIGNPLYQWTHLELKRYFGIEGRLLNENTAKDIYDECTKILQTDAFSSQGILQKMDIRLICTTDDPTDTLEHHEAIAEDSSFPVKVFPTFRPDAALALEDPVAWNAWVDRLGAAADVDVRDYDSFMEALRSRHEAFHAVGCRLADHGLDQPYAGEAPPATVAAIFDTVRAGGEVGLDAVWMFKATMLYEFGAMHAERGWVQQVHLGALRNTSTRILHTVGRDAGCDSMDDAPMARPLAALLDRLDREGKLARTILYNLNPRDNDLMATMVGNFQDGSVAGKMQYGSGWWFLDQKDGMEKQLESLSNQGLVCLFVGMLTDSRSFLSYTRHEYFRRILCNLLGSEIERGLLPNDLEMIGRMVQDICYRNAARYFQFGLAER